MTERIRFDLSKVHVRLIIQRDMEQVLDIERMRFEFPWTAEDFVKCCLSQRNCIGIVADVLGQDTKEGLIAGYAVYELHKTRLQLLNMAVATQFYRRGVGSKLIGRLQSRLSEQNRTLIACEVRESNVDAQLFFQAHGFRCVNVLRNFYNDTTDDAYLFTYRHRVAPPAKALSEAGDV